MAHGFQSSAFQNSAFQTQPAVSGSPDIAPVCLLYAPFNGDFTTTGTLNPNWGSPAGSWTTGRLANTQAFNGSGVFPATCMVEPRRGTLMFWARYDQGGTLELISAYPGPSGFKIAPIFGGGMTIFIWFDGQVHSNGSVQNQFDVNFNWGVGVWHHIVWTWVERRHVVYVDGVSCINAPNNVFHADSAFHIDMQNQPQLRVANSDAGVFAIQSLGLYNFAFSAADVAADFAATSLVPLSPSGPYGLTAMAQWAPGEGKAHVWCDGGNQYGGSDHYNYRVYKDGVQIATATAGAVRGYSQALVQMPGYMQPGNYYAQVDAVAADGSVRSTVQTDSFSMPSTIYLGNTAGLPVAGVAPSPYTPVTATGQKLSVWGRTYDLTGGWGLPVAITSQSQDMLAPGGMYLQVSIGGVNYSPTPISLTIDSVADDIAHWTAVSKVEPSSGFGVKFTVKGSLEFDGQMLLAMTYEPLGAPVQIDEMFMYMPMPSARSQYYSAAYNQGFPCVYHNDPAVVPWNNVVSRPGYTEGLLDASTVWTPSICFMDDDKQLTLELFIDNLSGWACDLTTTPYSVPCQWFTPNEVVNGVSQTRVQFDFVSPSYGLMLYGPRTIKWGCIAGPTKPMYSNWRTAFLGDLPSNGAGGSDLVDNHILRALVADGGGWPRTQNTLGLLWQNWRQAPGSASGDPDTDSQWISSALDNANFYLHKGRMWPYHQLHTLLGPALSGQYGTATMLNPIAAEINISASVPGLGIGDGTNDFVAAGYQALPTKGSSDFWAYWAQRNVQNRVMQGIYLDEPKYGNIKSDTGGNISARIIGGSGWTADNLVNYPGYNSQGSRAILRRLKKVFQDAGYYPSMMINYSFGYVPLHMWEPVDAVADLEGATLVPFGSGPIDGTTNLYWNVTTQQNYTRAITRAQKFGWSQHILKNSMQVANAPSNHNFRTWLAMAGLYDITPEGTYDGWWPPFWAARINWGMDDSDVVFHSYWAQTAITTWTGSNIYVSYYRKAGKAFLHVTNFNTWDYIGTTSNPSNLAIDLAALGFQSLGYAYDAQTGNPLTFSSTTITVAVPAMDYQLVGLVGTDV